MRTVLFLQSSLLLALLASAARPACAQAGAPAPTLGRNYVGLGGVAGGFAQGATGAASVLAPTFLAGRRLTPRLALELSVLVYHTRDDHTSQGIYLDTTGNSSTLKGATFRSAYQRRTQAVALAARYALVQRPASRLALDVVAGLALVHSDAYGYNATLDQATQQQVRGSYYVRYDYTGGCLLLGPSLRYQASPHLALVGEFIGNFAPGERVARLSRVAGTLGLSARYCFGAPPALAGRR